MLSNTKLQWLASALPSPQSATALALSSTLFLLLLNAVVSLDRFQYPGPRQTTQWFPIQYLRSLLRYLIRKPWSSPKDNCELACLRSFCSSAVKNEKTLSEPALTARQQQQRECLEPGKAIPVEENWATVVDSIKRLETRVSRLEATVIGLVTWKSATPITPPETLTQTCVIKKTPTLSRLPAYCDLPSPGALDPYNTKPIQLEYTPQQFVLEGLNSSVTLNDLQTESLLSTDGEGGSSRQSQTVSPPIWSRNVTDQSHSSDRFFYGSFKDQNCSYERCESPSMSPMPALQDFSWSNLDVFPDNSLRLFSSSLMKHQFAPKSPSLSPETACPACSDHCDSIDDFLSDHVGFSLSHKYQPLFTRKESFSFMRDPAAPTSRNGQMLG